MLKDEFADQFIYWENHIGDNYAIPETEARADWYAVPGVPTVRIDGKSSVVGASSCNGAYSAYRSHVLQHLAENGGMSPIEITGSYLISGGNLIASAAFRLVDPAALTDLRATIVLYEDHVNGQWPHVTRAIHDQDITLSDVNDEEYIEAIIPLDPSWFEEELTFAAYVQTVTGNREIYQGYMIPLLLDYTFIYEGLVRSVPTGDGVAVFEATLSNVGSATDTFTLQPGDPFGDWATVFLISGDSNPHSDPVELILDPAESCGVQVLVFTDETKEVRTGSFEVHSAFSDRTQSKRIRVYNGSNSLFLVDDDRNNDEEMPIVNAIEELGYLYEDWDVYFDHNGASPRYSNLSGYDFVLWHNSWWPQNPLPLSESDILSLMEYMDHGGSLFLTSQLLLNSPAGPEEFLTEYLGVADYALDAGYEQVYGVAGDSIGDSLDLPLDYPFSSLAMGDHIVAGPSATVCMTAPGDVNVTVRNEMGRGAKSVFMAFPFNAISSIDPDPNNIKTVLNRILDWLAPDTIDVEDVLGTILSSRIDSVRPNPFNPFVEVLFTLSPAGAAGLVELAIYDLEGRKIAGLFEGQLNPGPHKRTWNGLSDEGMPVRSGVYFGHLTTAEGRVGEKLVLLK